MANWPLVFFHLIRKQTVTHVRYHIGFEAGTFVDTQKIYSSIWKKADSVNS